MVPLSISLSGASSLYSQSKIQVSDPVVIAKATPESIHGRVRIKLPHIITWRLCRLERLNHIGTNVELNPRQYQEKVA